MLQSFAAYRPGTTGIFVPPSPVEHREDEYDPEAFAVLRDMQERHFWYRGRHRFILRAVRKELRKRASQGLTRPEAIDLGGGCGGWVRYLADACPGQFGELALSDSSVVALELAADVVPAGTPRYQTDLLNLQWRERWDFAFLLDVLEHIPQDEQALCQIRDSLRPGGVLFVATPALKSFWSYNDDLAHHVRRYSRSDFCTLATRCGFRLKHCRYFMFFLSPLLVLSRLRSPNIAAMTTDQIREHLRNTHRVPSRPVNGMLRAIFAAESPLGHWVRFPWGTSILGVFEKE